MRSVFLVILASMVLFSGCKTFEAKPEILAYFIDPLTTCGGLAPIIIETSRQARFLIPMAISLGFGILFATLITLVMVPCLYMIIEDIKNFFTPKEHQSEEISLIEESVK